MRALQVMAPRDVRLVKLPDPAPGPGQVLVRVAATAICTVHELLVFAGQYPPQMLRVEYPAPPGFPGHEAAGEIVAVGPGETHLAPGQLVATTGIGGEGTHAQLLLRAADSVVPLPAGADPVAAALCEPAGCVLHAVDLAGPLQGRTVAVAGLGPNGLLAVQLARRAGAASVLGLDPVPWRRALAERLGADETVDPLAPGAPERLEQAAEVVFECSGHARSVEQSFRTAARLLVVFGYTSDPIQVDQSVWFHRELEIRNARILGADPMATFRRAVELFAAGDLDLASLVSHRLPLERYRDALDLLAERHALKVVLTPDAG
jgi:2-desacetyl-2-hydroxyethyl bacteriochlorophyllide A dehydrogenase